VDWRASIDPEFAAVVVDGGPSIGDLQLDDLPALYDARRQVSVHPSSDEISVINLEVGSDPPVGVRVHRPKSQPGLAPCLLTIHGGSFIAGSNRMDDALLEQWCLRLGCVGVSIDYRLAPETTYPGPLQDCFAALRWVHEQADTLRIDRERVGVYGVSAGGALAAGTVLMAHDRGGPSVAFLLLDNAALDDRQLTESSHWIVPIASRATIGLGWRAYLGSLYGTDDVPVDAAPSRAQSLLGLPPTFISVGSVDGLHDENVDFADRLLADGVDVELHVYVGAPHTFCALQPQSRIATQCRDDQINWLRQQMKSRPP